MTVMPFVLLVVGFGMLVRGLMTVSRSRAAWMARSTATTASVVACKPDERSDGEGFAAFTISVRYLDAQGQPRTADLPAAQEFQAGDPVDVRFDPKHPATIYVSEQFAGTDLPAALIVFGGLLILMSLFFVTD